MTTYRKREEEPLQVEYSSEELPGFGYKLTRKATKKYAYFGLSFAAASRLAAIKVAKYTRDYSFVGREAINPEVVTLPNLTSEIAVELEEAAKYRVSIAVNEIDEKISETIDFARTFEEENSRDYDEGADQEYFEIARALYHGGTTPFFDIMIGNFGDKRAFQIEWKETPTSTTWKTLEHTHAFSGVYQQNYYGLNVPKAGAVVRLVSGEFVDDGVIVEEV